MTMLADFIDAEIEILSVGLNPSPNSVLHGFPFATVQNRFWRALNQSDLVDKFYVPGVDSMHSLLRDEHIGFTDVVKRTTRGASDLRVGDYRRWAPVLRLKIEHFCPGIVWFHGKVAYRNFVRYGLGRKVDSIAWGAQDDTCAGAAAFVSPNPSPANAVYSLSDISAWFDKLADLKQEQISRRAL
jgi:TDG/mug DNA glycosylase family protein